MLDDARLEKVFSTLADLDFKYFGIANHMMYHNNNDERTGNPRNWRIQS